MRKLMGLAMAALLSTTLLGCSDDASDGGSGGDGGEAVIGAVHPLTGELAGVGTMMSNAAKMAVQDINDAGGVKCLDGANLRLETGDSKGDAANGQNEAQRLIDGGAVALVGTYQSDVTQNVSAVAERSGVPLVIDVAVDDAILEQGYKNTFRIQPNATSMGANGGKALFQLAEQRGQPIDRVSYIHLEGAFGQSVFDAFEAEAKSAGVEVSEVTYSPTNFTDATTVVREAASNNPDVILATGYYPDSLLIAQSVQQLNPKIDALYGIANGAFDNTSFPSDAKKAAQGVLSANYHLDLTDDRVKDVRQRFQEEHSQPMETADMLSYQAVVVIEQALEKACSDDPAQVRDAISDIEINDPLLAFDGPIAFDKTGQNKNATVIATQVKNGEIEQVYPEDFRTAKLTYPAR